VLYPALPHQGCDPVINGEDFRMKSRSMTKSKLGVYSLHIFICSLMLSMSGLASARFGRSQVTMSTVRQPASHKHSEELFKVYVEDGTWKDLKYKNLKTNKTHDTGIDDPLAYATSGIYLAYVENDSWQDLEYINMETGEKKDSRVDKPLRIGVVGPYLLYVENSSWKDLEYIDMRTNEKKDTRIDDPSFIEYKDGTLYTDKGNYTFKEK